jgi:hypothetical protein
MHRPEFYEAGLLGTLLLACWNPMSRLAMDVAFDRETRRLELALRKSLHCDADARTAFRLLVEGREKRDQH